MADIDKNIIITPNIGQTDSPNIRFLAANSSVGPQTITMTALPANNGTLMFSNGVSNLFSISSTSIDNNVLSVIGSASFTGNVNISGSVLVSNTTFSIGTTSLIDISSNTFTTSATSEVSIDGFPSATYRSVKYLVQMTSSTSYHVIEMTVIHNGTDVWISQYGEIFTGSSLGTFTSSITSGIVNLLFTPTNSSTTVKLMRTSILV